MDYNTILVSIVAILISIVAYFLQRLVKTLDRIDSNVSQHTTEIATIKQTLNDMPEIKEKIDTIMIDFSSLRTEHNTIKNTCQNRR